MFELEDRVSWAERMVYTIVAIYLLQAYLKVKGLPAHQPPPARRQHHGHWSLSPLPPPTPPPPSSPPSPPPLATVSTPPPLPPRQVHWGDVCAGTAALLTFDIARATTPRSMADGSASRPRCSLPPHVKAEVIYS